MPKRDLFEELKNGLEDAVEYEQKNVHLKQLLLNLKSILY